MPSKGKALGHTGKPAGHGPGLRGFLLAVWWGEAVCESLMEVSELQWRQGLLGGVQRPALRVSYCYTAAAPSRDGLLYQPCILAQEAEVGQVYSEWLAWIAEEVGPPPLTLSLHRGLSSGQEAEDGERGVGGGKGETDIPFETKLGICTPSLSPLLVEASYRAKNAGNGFLLW